MAIQYVSLTQDEQDRALADAIHGREVEHAHYSLNAANYAALLDGLKGLPEDWPPNIAAWKGKSRDQIAAGVPGAADAELALALAHRDRLRLLLRTEQHERDKVATYHGQLLARLPAGPRRDNALAAAKAKREGV